MRHLKLKLTSKLSISVATAGLMCATVSTASLAADPYTYRSGNVYAKSIATDYTQCEAQCRGDAGCRGWNYVRPNPRSRSGICEFNANKAQPVSSPISMSGEIDTGVDTLMSHAVPMQGSTVRVGTPIVPKHQIAAQQSRPQSRIINALPVEGPRIQTVPAHIQRTISSVRPDAPNQMTQEPPADIHIPRVYGGAPVAPKVASASIQARPDQHSMPAQAGKQALQQQMQQQMQQQGRVPQHLSQQQIAYRQQMLAAQRRAAIANGPPVFPQQMPPQHIVPQQMPARSPQGFTQQGYAHPQARQMQRRVPQAQFPTQHPEQTLTQSLAQTPSQHPTPPQGYTPNSASLYGSLYDDLTKGMTEVPRPQTAPDQPANPNAPMSTGAAVPSIPVHAAPLGLPAIQGLAGG